MVTSALVDVRDIVDWLVHTEEQIGHLYRAAAKVCCQDASFSSFLVELADDEQLHAEFMSRAWGALCTAKERPTLAMVLDHETRRQVEELFDRFRHLLTKAKVSRKDVVEYIARAESSELNPIFLYVADEYRKVSRAGEHMTGEIQGHLLRIQSFVKNLPKDERPSVDVCSLPSVGEPRFLVVDDHGPVRRLMASLLSRRGLVDTAEGTPEGLERLREHFHDGVVSDIRMPGMDGLEFYKRAIEYDDRLRRRFLFCSGDVDPEIEQRLREDKLPLLKKPFGLHDFYAAIERILIGHDDVVTRDP